MFKNLCKICQYRCHIQIVAHTEQAITNSMGRRYLFSSEILGIENFKRQQASIQDRVGNLKEKFRSRMEEYMISADKNTIFTDDLKTIIHIADDDQDLDTAVKMIKRFHEQSDELRFSAFVFGPIVLRMLHIMQRPDIAYQLFMDQEMNGFFDQMSTYVVLLDLLYENEEYDKVLEVFGCIKDKQLEGVRYPVDCVTLALASCFRMGTEEAFNKASSILEECKKTSTNVSMRSVVYASYLALKVNKPNEALEILSMASFNAERVPVAYKNIKAQVYSRLDRTEEAVQILRAVLENDVPDHVQTGQEIFHETIDTVKEAVVTQKDKDISRQMEILEKSLHQGNHISQISFSEYLLRPVIRKRKLQDGYKHRQRSSVKGFRRDGGGRREGLRE